MTWDSLSRRDFLRTMGAAAAGLSVTGALAACGGGGSSSGAASGSRKSLTLSYLNASSGQEKALKQLNALYEQQTGVHIELTTDALTYPQTLLARAQAKAMPDLYYPGQTGSLIEHAPYVKAGWAKDLSKEMSAGWKDSFGPELLAYTTYKTGNAVGVKPGTYSIPFDGENWQFLYNPSLCQKAGVDFSTPPATFAEFLVAAKKLKKVIPQAFGMNLAQAYGTEAFFLTFGSSLMSVKDIVSYCAGQKPWTSPEWTEVLSLFEQIRDADILAPGAVTWQMPNNEQGFFSQKTLACYFGFSISIPVGNRLAPDFSDYGAFVAPPIKQGATVSPAGGMGKSVAVNAKGSHVSDCIDYLKWFTSQKQQAQYATLLPTIPSNPKVPDSALDRRVIPFKKAMTRILPPEAALQASVSDALNKGVQQIMTKQSTPDKVLAAMQAAQAKI